MSKILTSLSIISIPEGKSVSYTYSELDTTGVITRSNVRQSFIATDSDLLDKIDKFEKKIINDKNIK